MLASFHRHAFEQVAVVSFNALPHMRSLMRDILLALGFRNVSDIANLERLREAIAERSPDLLLLDLDHDTDAVCGLVRDLRQSNVASDPFLPVVALSWTPNEAAVKNALDSGIDDLIIMPLSTAQMKKRIDVLIHERKKFVVTSSYVGPDRRKANEVREDTLGLGTIAVPNNLRYKATGDVKAAASAGAVAAIQTQVSSHRVKRYAQRIGWLADEMPKFMNDKKTAKDRIARDLDEALDLVNALATDLDAQGNTALREICESMRRVIIGLRAAPTRQLFELLKVHALGATATLMGHEGAADMVVAALNEARAKLAHESDSDRSARRLRT